MFKRLWYRKVVTFGIVGLIFAVCLSCFGLNQQASKRARADEKITIEVTASRSLVKLRPNPPFAPDNCEPTESQVRLYANTTSPFKGDMNFTWQVPVGRLIAKNREATWDLSDVKEGTYTATVEASNKHKHTASASITVAVVMCPSFLPDPPPCATISVSCPSTAESKGSVTFEATVSGGPEITPTFEWSLSAGKIISGQGTPKITVDVSSLGHKSVTATVTVGGEDPNCNNVASCTVLEIGETDVTRRQDGYSVGLSGCQSSILLPSGSYIHAKRP
jgi:PKD domain-containing protein